jgi:hypothetical protein
MIKINCLRSTHSFAPPGGQPGRQGGNDASQVTDVGTQ